MRSNDNYSILGNISVLKYKKYKNPKRQSAKRRDPPITNQNPKRQSVKRRDPPYDFPIAKVLSA